MVPLTTSILLRYPSYPVCRKKTLGHVLKDDWCSIEDLHGVVVFESWEGPKSKLFSGVERRWEDGLGVRLWRWERVGGTARSET